MRERSHRGVGEERFVGMPHRRGVSFLGIKNADVFKAGAEIREERMDFDLANSASEGHVLFGSEVRSVDGQDLVLNECIVHSIKSLIIEIGAEIESCDLRSKGGSESTNLHRVMLTLFPTTRRFAGPAAGWRPLILGDWFHDKSV